MVTEPVLRALLCTQVTTHT